MASGFRPRPDGQRPAVQIINIFDDVARQFLRRFSTPRSLAEIGALTTPLIEQRGKPGMIVSDNGTEFTSNAMLSEAQDNRIIRHFTVPGKTMQSGYCESFNGRMRGELRNERLILEFDHARTTIANWIDDYNQRRPHSTLGDLTPTAYAANLSTTCDRLRTPD